MVVCRALAISCVFGLNVPLMSPRCLMAVKSFRWQRGQMERRERDNLKQLGASDQIRSDGFGVVPLLAVGVWSPFPEKKKKNIHALVSWLCHLSQSRFYNRSDVHVCHSTFFRSILCCICSKRSWPQSATPSLSIHLMMGLRFCCEMYVWEQRRLFAAEKR